MKSIARVRGTKLFVAKHGDVTNVIFDDTPTLNLQRDRFAGHLNDELEEPVEMVTVKASPAAYKPGLETFSATSPMATRTVQGKLEIVN